MRQAVTTTSAPKAIGPYSQAIRAGNLLFVSGQIPIDPATGNLIDGDIAAQTHRVFANLGALLKTAGLTFANVVRTTCANVRPAAASSAPRLSIDRRA